MTFALCLQVPNFIQFKHKSSIWAEFVPQLLFFHSIFGYLVVCILYKWSIDWSKTDAAPPGLLNMLIYMFLSPSEIREPLYPGQMFVQKTLVLIALICIPWMLCTKPYLVWREMHQNKSQGYINLGQVDAAPAREEHDDTLDEQEAGNGAHVAEAEDQHVSESSSETSAVAEAT